MFSEFIALNIWWFVALVVVLNLLLFSFIQGAVPGAKSVSALELPGLQRSGKFVIFDVNPAAQFAKGHIAGAQNIALSDITADNKKIAKHKNSTVIITCQTGSQSAKAAKALVGLGFTKVHLLKGGIIAWQKENLPLIAG